MFTGLKARALSFLLLFLNATLKQQDYFATMIPFSFLFFFKHTHFLCFFVLLRRHSLMLFSHFTVLHGRITLSTHCTEVKSSPVWAPHQGKSTKAMGLPQQRPALGEQLCPTGGQCQAPSWPRGHRASLAPSSCSPAPPCPPNTQRYSRSVPSIQTVAGLLRALWANKCYLLEGLVFQESK